MNKLQITAAGLVMAALVGVALFFRGQPPAEPQQPAVSAAAPAYVGSAACAG